MAHRPVVRRLQRSSGCSRVWKRHRHMDHFGSQKDEDCDQLLLIEPGVFGRVHGRVQHFDKLYLRRPRRVVFWGGLLQIPQLLPGHVRVRQHLLHECDSGGQVRHRDAVKVSIHIHFFCCYYLSFTQMI